MNQICLIREAARQIYGLPGRDLGHSSGGRQPGKAGRCSTCLGGVEWLGTLRTDRRVCVLLLHCPDIYRILLWRSIVRPMVVVAVAVAAVAAVAVAVAVVAVVVGCRL